MKPFQVPRPEIPAQTWHCPLGAAQQGLPLGGLGSGGIRRSPGGSFDQWSLDAGEQVAQVLPACQFALFEQPENGVPQAYALATEPKDRESLGRWQWYPHGQGSYHALYPRSWYQYEGVFQSEIVCEQFSPLWPGCYQESSYPVGLFNWTFHNPTDAPITLSLLVTWHNSVGWFTNAAKQTPGNYQAKWQESTGNYNQWITDHFRVGCLFNRIRPYDTLQEGDGQMAIASITNPALEVYHIGRWNPEGDGAEVWDWFARNGMLADQQDETPAEPGEQIASAIAIRFTVRPGRGRKIPVILAWDLPVMEFAPAVNYFQRHSDFFARTGNNAWTVVRTALKHGDVWRDKIIAWQQTLLQRSDIPTWFPAVLCNSLAPLVSSGTLWTAGTETAPIGQFARLNGDYCYEDLVRRLTDSFATFLLFPRLDKAVLEAYSRAIATPDTIPQNLGSPRNHPWEQAAWLPDAPQQSAIALASAFVVQVYRNYRLTGATDTEFLWECWGAIAQVLQQNPETTSDSPLWPVALAAAHEMGTALLDTPPMNPALEPDGYPDSLAAQVEQCRDRLTICATVDVVNEETLLAILYVQILGLAEQVGDRLPVDLADQFIESLSHDAPVQTRLLCAAYRLSQGDLEAGWAIVESVDLNLTNNDLDLYWLLYGLVSGFKIP